MGKLALHAGNAMFYISQSGMLTNILPCLSHSSNFLFEYGWVQSGVVRRFNDFVDNHAKWLWKGCKDMESSIPKNVQTFFWLFARLMLVIHGIRPGFVMVKDNDEDSSGHLRILSLSLRGLRRKMTPNMPRLHYLSTTVL